MIVIGIALLIVAALIEFVGLTVVGALVLAGAGLVALGILVGERLPRRS